MHSAYYTDLATAHVLVYGIECEKNKHNYSCVKKWIAGV